MKLRALAATLTLPLLLCACGAPASGSASSAPAEPLTVGILALELPAGADLQAARDFAAALPGALAAQGVEIGTVELSFGASPAATAQALAEGGVDLAFLPAADFLAGGGGQAILADGEQDASGALTPGERAEIAAAPTDYGRRLASRTSPTWEELSHARWGVLGEDSRAGYRCLDLWLCDNYEDNGVADLPQVTVYEDWDGLLRAAEAGDIDALPLPPGLRDERFPLLAETEAIVSQVAAVRRDAALTSPAFAAALEAALQTLFQDKEPACQSLLGAEHFTPLQNTPLAPTQRSLAGQ